MKAVLLALSINLTCGGIAAAQEGERNADGWLELAEESNLDGSVSYIASKDAANRLANAIGRLEASSLNLSCIDKVLSVSLSWPDFLGLDQVFVDASVDRGQVRKWTFDVPRGARGIAVFRGSGNWRRFTEAVAGGERITFRVHAYQAAQEATFDLNGIDEVQRRAIQTCST